ncbi:MAG: hypothetical protein ACXVMS_11150 [Flavisolibacter sp.]
MRQWLMAKFPLKIDLKPNTRHKLATAFIFAGKTKTFEQDKSGGG